MKEISKSKKFKVLFWETVAMTSLGLVSTNNLKTVKADSISSKQSMAKTTKSNLKKVPAVQLSENKKQTDATANQDIATNNSQDRDDTTNAPDATTPDQNQVETDVNKSDTSKPNTNELYCMWNGLKVSYDTVNGILTIPGSSEVIQNPDTIARITFSPSPDNDAEKIDSEMIKKIKITGPLKFTGSLTGFFENMVSLTEIEGLNNFDTSEVTEMSYMFSSCEKLRSIDVSSFDTHNVRDMDYMFARCLCLEELDLSKFKLTSLRNADQMLQELPELSLLVLGSNASGYGEPEEYNLLTHCELDTSGTWFNVGKGTDDEPEGLKQWSSGDLRENFRGETDADRYVRLAYLTVHYVDEKNNKIAADSTIKARRLSKKTIEPKVIPGYTLKTSPVNYRFIDGQHEIAYVYYPTPAVPSVPVTPNKAANVTVKYQDERGNSLTSDEILTGQIGDGYVSKAEDIPGYSLKSRPANATGFFSDQAQTVIYVYSSLQPDKPSSAISVIPNQPDSKNNSEISTAKSFSKISRKKDPYLHHGASQSVHKETAHKASHFDGQKLNDPKGNIQRLNNSKRNWQDGKLPQTGTNRSSQFIFITFGLVALLASLLGISIKRKNKD